MLLIGGADYSHYPIPGERRLRRRRAVGEREQAPTARNASRLVLSAIGERRDPSRDVDGNAREVVATAIAFCGVQTSRTVEHGG
jgi:hypothetical protein